MSCPRLLVLACDALDPAVVLGHLDRLPTLTKLCREGAYGSVDSVTHSCDIWTTYYTGLAPETHGIVASRLALAKGPADLSQVKTDLFLWDWLNRYGLSTGFVEPLHAYPAPVVNGFFLSGQPRPGLSQSDRTVFPPALKGLVDREYSAGIPAPPSLKELGVTTPFVDLSDDAIGRLFADGYFQNFPEHIRPHLDWYTDLVIRLRDRYPVDVLWVYFLEADIAGHFSFHDKPSGLLLRTYAELDRAFGKLIDRLQPENVVVVSDHGMVPIARLLTEEQHSPLMQSLAAEYRVAGTRLISPELAVVEGYNKGLCTGTHNYQAFYAAGGPGIHRGTRVDIHFHDVFPMLMRTLGMPVPEGRAGRTPPIFNEFAHQRASEYDNLQWVGHTGYLDAFLACAQLDSRHHVLEAGIGTGQVAERASGRVARYVGVDNSPDMLAIAAGKLPGLSLIRADLQQIPVPEASFDRVLVRSVLHHLTTGLAQAVRELYRVLRPGGRLVIGEGIPPSPAAIAHFTEVFRLKEERLVLLPEHLVHLLEVTGFVDIRYTTYVMPQVSIRNWLDQSDLSPALKAQLLEMHRTTSAEVQRDYRTTITADDVLVDFTFAMVSGRRP